MAPTRAPLQTSDPEGDSPNAGMCMTPPRPLAQRASRAASPELPSPCARGPAPLALVRSTVGGSKKRQDASNTAEIAGRLVNGNMAIVGGVEATTNAAVKHVVTAPVSRARIRGLGGTHSAVGADTTCVLHHT